MNIANSITDLVGRTPMLELHRMRAKMGFEGRIFAKIESFNPGGSAKDRVAVAMVDAAGLSAGDTIIEPTSGNTGVGLAMVAAARGLRLILTMPESMSLERRALLAAYGAELVLTPAAQGMQGAVDRAEQLRHEIDGAVILGQFSNPANPAIHRATTAVEIWDDMNGQIDVFVATIGTGGTVSGVGAALKKYNPLIEIVGVEPASSPLLTQGIAAPHKIQGIGANFVPANVDRTVIDRILTVGNEEAFDGARDLARTEGLLVGISSGAAYVAAARQAACGGRVVVLLPDTGERYLSSGVF
ncbi:MAG: cysteine synthase A [Mucinivorans sp.]